MCIVHPNILQDFLIGDVNSFLVSKTAPQAELKCLICASLYAVAIYQLFALGWSIYVLITSILLNKYIDTFSLASSCVHELLSLSLWTDCSICAIVLSD